MLRHRGIIFRLKWFLNNGAPWHKNTIVGKQINNKPFFYSRRVTEHGSFHPVAVLFFSKFSFLGEVLKLQN